MNREIEETKIAEIRKDLYDAISYDAWAGREYGVTEVDYDFSARKLYYMGYRKSADVAREIFDEIMKSLPERDFYSSSLAMGYEWALSEIRKTLIKLRKKYESEGEE